MWHGSLRKGVFAFKGQLVKATIGGGGAPWTISQIHRRNLTTHATGLRDMT